MMELLLNNLAKIMDYQYDVFFSYKRDRQSDDWHEKVKGKLEFWLKQELERTNVRIFFDTEEIRTGTQWRQKLTEALKGSRCIVCIWSPLYFQSRWCFSEWMTFVRRAEMANRDLVMPASFFDGERFPPAAKASQFLDFSPFASTMPSFWQTELAVRFEPLLQRFARDLAIMIKGAPPYDNQFPIIEVSEQQVLPGGTVGRPANV